MCAMSFNSILYILFLPIVIWIHFTLPRRYQYIWLFAASLLFYLSNDIRYVFGLSFCIATTYFAAILIEKTKLFNRKIILGLCISVNVFALILFRLLWKGSAFAPLGISFYALQAMGYVIDVFRGKTVSEKNVIRYAVYVAFFPTVISGPIQRSTVLLPQLRNGRNFDYGKARIGLYHLLSGYLLKIVIADQLAGKVSFAYNNPDTLPGAALLWATFLYAIQIYCDFAGYSALAIGSAEMLGFDMDANFRQPYFAVSIKDFWGRWHISLSSWLKDYVYIPLGGSRKGKLRTQFNLMVTFLVSGLWHGGGNYIVWGILHGAYNIAGNIRRQLFLKRNPPAMKAAAGLMKDSGDRPDRKGRLNQGRYYTVVSRIFHMAVTFVLVDFAWLFFRADSFEHALNILKRILFDFHFKEMTFYGSYLLGGTKAELVCILFCVIAVFLVDVLHEKNRSIEKIMKDKVPIVIRWTVYIILTLLLVLVIIRNYGQAATTFIYETF